MTKRAYMYGKIQFANRLLFPDKYNIRSSARHPNHLEMNVRHLTMNDVDDHDDGDSELTTTKLRSISERLTTTATTSWQTKIDVANALAPTIN